MINTLDHLTIPDRYSEGPLFRTYAIYTLTLTLTPNPNRNSGSSE